jgi:hypothetical protein
MKKKPFFYTTDRRKFKCEFVIVVDKDHVPMFFSGDQFVYSNSRKTAKAPVEIYTKEEAERLIKKHRHYRRTSGYIVDIIRTIPVYKR